MLLHFSQIVQRVCTLVLFSLYLLVETGQLPGAGLTQADKTCIQLNFYLEILKRGHLGFKGGAKAHPVLPKFNHEVYDYAVLLLISLLL